MIAALAGLALVGGGLSIIFAFLWERDRAAFRREQAQWRVRLREDQEIQLRMQAANADLIRLVEQLGGTPPDLDRHSEPNRVDAYILGAWHQARWARTTQAQGGTNGTV